MNTFALEIWDDEGEGCCFYTVRWQNAEDSETDRFFLKFEQIDTLKEKAQELLIYLQDLMGVNGAHEKYIKWEGRAQAVPRTDVRDTQLAEINLGDFPLRLYCLKLNEELVVLFNGGQKTTQGAIYGDTAMAFAEAQKFAQGIKDALELGDIYIDSDQRTIHSNTENGLNIEI